MLKKVCFPFLKNNFFLIPRDVVGLLFNYYTARVSFFFFPVHFSNSPRQAFLLNGFSSARVRRYHYSNNASAR